MRHDARERLRDGLVIPAHPLALDPDRRLDEQRQQALTRYYLMAGAGGIAVGVHTTQFGIRDPSVALYQPVLALAAATIDEHERSGGEPIVRVAGIIGPTAQATAEAAVARRLGYDVGLVSLGGLEGMSLEQLIDHVRAVGDILPVMGFYLQPAVGGRDLPQRFWRSFAELEQVVAIKIAPFNRYRTLDVVRAVVEVGREDDIALYTGNDDHIVLDLLTPFQLGARRPIQIVGGLLGQWAVWTRRAVELHAECRQIVLSGAPIPTRLMTIANQLTDANAAIFDAAHEYAGCIPGVHEILHRQGLLQGTWCLDYLETLSPGQLEEINRVLTAYPHLTDDEFVSKHRDRWAS